MYSHCKAGCSFVVLYRANARPSLVMIMDIMFPSCPNFFERKAKSRTVQNNSFIKDEAMVSTFLEGRDRKPNPLSLYKLNTPPPNTKFFQNIVIYHNGEYLILRGEWGGFNIGLILGEGISLFQWL